MKRRDFLTKAGAGAALGATFAGGAGSALAQAQPLRWRMSTMWPKSLDAMHGSAEAMAKRVGEITEGRFNIQATAAGEIVPPPQVFDAVQNGTIECGHVLSSFFFGKDPAIGFDAGLPFGLNARQQAAWMNFGGGLYAVALQRLFVSLAFAWNVTLDRDADYREDLWSRHRWALTGDLGWRFFVP